MLSWAQYAAGRLFSRPATVPIMWAVVGAGMLLITFRHADAALAQEFGGSGYSANLSHNAAIRHQQLICDPQTGNGSASVLYDPKVVTPSSIFNVAGYTIQNEYIGVLIGGAKEVEPASTFFGTPNPTPPPEWGYVQVGWSGPNSASPFSQIIGASPSMGSQLTSDGQAGPTASNTFGLEFSYLGGVADSTVANYTVYAEKIGYPIIGGGIRPAGFYHGRSRFDANAHHRYRLGQHRRGIAGAIDGAVPGLLPDRGPCHARRQARSTRRSVRVRAVSQGTQPIGSFWLATYLHVPWYTSFGPDARGLDPWEDSAFSCLFPRGARLYLITILLAGGVG